MKKIIGIVVLIALGVAAQSCGGGEKCPAYSHTTAQDAAVNV